ncbi:mitochondrial peptidyl-tRNA hydrolase [Xylaria sp. FL0043]|nr:mitochondrial peptidyl-tRNA hydrolase [Xylaria sp. FL0043]
MTMRRPRFLVVSLGNQAPYYDCLHSLGHFALAAALKVLTPSRPEFAPEKYGRKSCKAAWWAHPYTFLQSPTMMNNCGPWVHAAWKDELKYNTREPRDLALVLVHDELEAAFGEVKVRKWEASPKGHNGVRSVRNSMDPRNYPCDRWRRITVGIGRPKERNSAAVSEYVLRKMTSEQLQTIDTKIGPEIVRCLTELRHEWEQTDRMEERARRDEVKD